MPREKDDRSADRGASGGRKRYAAVVEKGDNAWKREWSSFMSGVSLKRLRDGSSGVSLKASADIERQIESTALDDATTHPKRKTRAEAAAAPEEVNSDGIPLSAAAASVGFSYLFSSPAERRAEREMRERQEKEKRLAKKREEMAKKDPLSVLSKHQRALYDATQRGLQLEGMNRKARRDFLHLTVSEEQKRAEAQARDFKLHDLMDEKLAWYQQGPHPVDLIAEKLVRRKAEKKAKQLGLKYNYLVPHASWLAKRAQRRRESLLVGLGKRLVFNDSDEADTTNGSKGATAEMEGLTVTDPLHQRTVPLKDIGLLLAPAPRETAAAASTAAQDDAAAEAAVDSVLNNSEEEEEEEEGGVGEADGQEDSQQQQQQNEEDADEEAPEDVMEAEVEDRTNKNDSRRRAQDKTKKHGNAMGAPARLPDVGVLQDPSRIATSVVRRVVRDRATAVAIQQLNRTTTFLSSGLVKGPSLMPEDTALAKGLPAQSAVGAVAQRQSKTSNTAAAAAAGSSKRPTRASKAPSFSPLPSFSPFGEDA